MQRTGIIAIQLRATAIMLMMMTLNACGLSVKTQIIAELAQGSSRAPVITDADPAVPKAGSTVTLTGTKFPTRTKNLVARVVLADSGTKDSTLNIVDATSATFTVPTDTASDVKTILMMHEDKTLATYDIKASAVGTIDAVTFSPAAGTYAGTQSITIASTRPGVTIYYTTDGSTPTASSSVYSSAINVATTQTLKAYAVKATYSDSGVGVAAYTINGAVQTPVGAVAGGAYSNNQSVTLATVPMAASIYYTTDGSTPTTGSTLYSGAITISGTTTLKAFAVMANYLNSAVMTKTYTLTAAAPTMSVAAGTYTLAQSVTLATTTTGASIYYTTNGTAPTASSTLYSSAIAVTATKTINAIAIKANYTDSSVTSTLYTINTITPVAIEGFPDTTNYPTVTWYPSVKFNLDSNDTIGLFSNNSGTTMNTPAAATAGSNILAATTSPATTAGNAYSVYARNATETSYVNMGSYTAKLPPNFSVPGTNGAVRAVRKDDKSTGCVTAPYCLIVAGDFTYVGAHAYNHIMRIKQNGSIEALGNGLNSYVTDAAIDSTGNVYAVGAFTCAGGSTPSGTYPSNTCSGSGGTTVLDMVAKWDGSNWSSLGRGVDSTPYSSILTSAAVDSSDNLYIGGGFETVDGTGGYDNIAKWNGSSWSSVGTGLGLSYPQGSEYVNSLVIDGLGNLYAGGCFTCSGGGSVSSLWFPNQKCSSGTTTLNNIAKFNGTAWSALAGGVDTEVDSLAVDGSNNLYVGGAFTNSTSLRPGATLTAAAALTGISFTNGSTTTGALSSVAEYWVGQAYTSSNTGVITSGTISSIDTTNKKLTMNRYATATGTSDLTFPLVASNSSSTNALPSVASYTAGMTYTSSAPGTLANGYITGFSTGTKKLLLSTKSTTGAFTGTLTFGTAGFAQISPGIAKWNGSAWSAVGTGFNDVVRSLDFDGSGNLYAGGDFQCAGGSTSTGTYPYNTCSGTGGTTVFNRLAKWDGTSWSALGTGVDGASNALAFDGLGKLYLGGGFTTINGGVVSNIATWDGTTTSPLSTVGMNGGINALVTDSSGNIFAGGDFSGDSGVANTSYIAKWNGTSWNALGTGMNGSVYALLYDSTNSVLYAGGSFTTAGGVPANFIAKWDGTSWSAVGAGFDSGVRSLALDGSGNLYAGGYFFCAAGSSSFGYSGNQNTGDNTCAGTGGTTVFNHIAKWNGSSWSNLVTGYPGVDGTVYALAVDSSQNVYVGGYFTVRCGNVACGWLAKWTPGTSTWSNGGEGVGNAVHSFAIDGSGNIYAGGNGFLIKWDGSSWADFGTTAGNISALYMSGGNLYVGGGFSTIGGMSATNLAKWNGTTWSAFGTGTDNGVNAITLDSSGNLYVGGYFNTAGDLVRPYIAKWITALSKWF